MNRTILPWVLAVGMGCVSTGKYDALQAEHTALSEKHRAQSAQLGDAQRKETELSQALAAEQKRAADLQERSTKLESDMASMLKDRSKLQASVSEMQAALAEMQKRREQAEARISEYKGLLAKFRSMIDAGRLKVKLVDGKMVVVLATDVLFGSGSASLSAQGKAAVAEVSGLLASIPNRSFQIEGHTDNIPIATAQYPSNWELAAGRALTVLKTMVAAGMPPDRISAAAFADAKPAASNDTPEGQGQNRRIEIIIVPDLSSLPGFDELQRIEGRS